MAEAVGLAASIVALAGLATTVLKLVGQTSSFVNNMRNRDEETKRMMGRISFAADSIEIVQVTLLKFCSADTAAPRSQVIRFIESHDAATYMRTESECLLSHVDRLSERLHDLQSKWVPVATILWRYFIKEQMYDLREDMEFFRATLHMLLDCVFLEEYLQKKPRDELKMHVTPFPKLRKQED